MSEHEYRPGDTANGYVLTERDGWVREVDQWPAPEPSDPRPVRRRWWVLGSLVAVLLLVLGVGLAGGSTDQPATTASSAGSASGPEPEEDAAAQAAEQAAQAAQEQATARAAAEQAAAEQAAAAAAEAAAAQAAAVQAEAQRVAEEQAAAAAAAAEQATADAAVEAQRVAEEQARQAAEEEEEAIAPQAGCHPSYEPCVPLGRDYDCGELRGSFSVVGPDEYRLDADDDGIGCEAN